MEQRFEQLMIEQAAPTLMGMKPANLFRCCTQKREQIRRDVTLWNRNLEPFGVSVEIVKECSRTGSLLIYIYRRNYLERILENREVRVFLKTFGYRPEVGFGKILAQLSKRLCLEENFPHEIGVFLGYPLRDVIGFIRNKGENYTCCGCWKAYGDPDEARRRFETYRLCTDLCKARFQQGIPVIQLVVAA